MNNDNRHASNGDTGPHDSVLARANDSGSDRWQLPDWLVDADTASAQGDKTMSTETWTAGLIASSPETPLQAGKPEQIDQIDLIQASWHRSKQAGLAPEMTPDFSGATESRVKDLLDESRQLGTLAYPVMQALHEQIANTHSTVVLTDGEGRILYSMGDDSFLERAEKVALKPGVDWSEAAKGTNAIGTAIALQRPVTVHADQHFLTVNQFLTCSSTPIFSPRGTVAGVLDVTGDARGYHRHTMALARMSAQIIENQIFSQTYEHAIRLHFHSRPEFIGTLFEGMVAFSRGGRFLAANRGALFQVGLDRVALERQTLSSLFGMPIDELIDHCRSSNPGLLSLSLPNGLTVRAKAEVQGHMLWTVAGLTPGARADDTVRTATPPTNDDLTAEAMTDGPTSASLVSGGSGTGTQATAEAARRQREHMSSLHYLDTGDPQVAAVIQKIRRVQGRDIPILILGETGVGKELLAKAIHNDSARSQHPFVAVNCASIPENLIESELFGYDEGAFTGAKRKGAMGKIQLANGGTLFLDEIGDMPVTMQARLLRALQERVITPLGSNRNITVNVAVISATHRNLRQRVTEGLFREDLYYRLNGLAVRLPALRERTDLNSIIRHVLLAASEPCVKHRLSTAVADMFCRYNWPGNVRQLANVLRTACVLAGTDTVIDVEHLPDDFVEEVGNITHLGLRLDTAVPHPMVPGMVPVYPQPQGQQQPPYPLPLGAPVNDGTARALTDLPLGADTGAVAQPPQAAGAGGLQEMELQAIKHAVAKCGGNVSAAARLLGVSRNTVYRKLPELAQKGE